MFLRRFVSLLLVTLILFAETGQVVYAHTCFKSNKTSYSLFAPSHCKSEAVKRTCCTQKHNILTGKCRLGKMSCCGVTAKFIKQSFPSTNVERSGIATFVCTFFLLSIFILQPAQLSARVSEITSSLPPLLQNKISFTQVFRC